MYPFTLVLLKSSNFFVLRSTHGFASFSLYVLSFALHLMFRLELPSLLDHAPIPALTSFVCRCLPLFMATCFAPISGCDVLSRLHSLFCVPQAFFRSPDSRRILFVDPAGPSFVLCVPVLLHTVSPPSCFLPWLCAHRSFASPTVSPERLICPMPARLSDPFPPTKTNPCS